jgi:hypothetical protein
MNLTKTQVQARYRAAHPERKVIEAAASARYRARHPERAGVAQKKWRAAHPAEHKASQLAWASAHPAHGLVNAARRRAKVKKLPFDITWKDISPLPEFCPVLGLRLAYGPGRGRSLYENRCAASLDRIKNEKGYVKGNVIVVSLRANLLKGQATIDELQRIATFYSRQGESVS